MIAVGDVLGEELSDVARVIRKPCRDVTVEPSLSGGTVHRITLIRTRSSLPSDTGFVNLARRSGSQASDLNLSAMTVLEWLLDSDPAVRWQVLRDLADAPPEVVAAERARVATEGWGARLLALRDEDGQWAGGAYFPAQRGRADEEQSSGDHTDDGGEEAQPWTATTYSLLLLRDFGVDPQDDQVRETVALVSNHCRWEEGGQRYFDGEVEPCINGMTVALGAYFGQARRRCGGPVAGRAA